MAPVLIKPKVTPEIVEPAAKRPRRASLLAVADVSAGKIQTAPRKDDKPEISHDRQAMEPITLNNNLRNIVADCGDETKRNVDTDAEKQQKISAIADELQSFIELKENQMKLAELKKKDETKVAGMMGNKTENAEWKEPGEF